MSFPGNRPVCADGPVRSLVRTFIPFVITGCLMGVIGLFIEPDVFPTPEHTGDHAGRFACVVMWGAAAVVAIVFVSSILVHLIPWRRNGRGVSRGMGFIVYSCAAAISAFGYAAWLDREAAAQAQWSATEAMILSFRRHTVEGRPSRGPSPRLDSQYVYSYCVDRTRYKGKFIERVYLNTPHAERRIRHRHDRIQVFYNLRDPSVSTVRRAQGGRNQALWAACLLSLALLTLTAQAGARIMRCIRTQSGRRDGCDADGEIV